jgi:UDP-N-acetylmuramoyl-L-alanyl-D-glutamate--2,6-diaminopimelate ligase
MELEKLIRRLDKHLVTGTLARDVTSICYDSRQVVPGSLFCAIEGIQVDGHAFIGQAIERGATAVVSQKPHRSTRATHIQVQDSRDALARLAATFYQDPSTRLQLVGVTGTNGKTTTTFLVKHLLERAGQRTGLIGTVGYQIGERVLPAQRTTPESVDLQQLFSQALDAGCVSLAMEVSSIALALNRVDEIRFRVGVFTNLTQDHLDFHHGMKEYFQAKEKLFTKISDDLPQQGIAVINVDDPYGQQLVARFSNRLNVVSYGMGARADFRASNYRVESTGTSYQLDLKGKSYLVRVPLIGRFNIYNSLAALATVSALGVDIRSSVLALARAPQIPGRLEAVPVKRQFQVFVDYAHTDDALMNVVRTCRDLNPARLILVFGCGGDRDRAKRPIMGAVADKYTDYAIVTSDNPRKENPEAIINEVVTGFKGRNFEIVVDRREAINRAITLAGPRDIVLIAGKGHEKYQEFHDHTVPFDDVEVALRALEDHPVKLSDHGA